MKPKKLKRLLPSLPKLKKRLDNVFNLWVRIRGKRRNGGICEVPWCPTKSPIFCAYHCLPCGDYPGTRYDPDNVVASCAGCNKREVERRALEQNRWRYHLGNEKYDALCEKGRQVTKYSRDELMGMIRLYSGEENGTTRA